MTGSGLAQALQPLKWVEGPAFLPASGFLCRLFSVSSMGASHCLIMQAWGTQPRLWLRRGNPIGSSSGAFADNFSSLSFQEGFSVGSVWFSSLGSCSVKCRLYSYVTYSQWQTYCLLLVVGLLLIKLFSTFLLVALQFTCSTEQKHSLISVAGYSSNRQFMYS